MEEKNKEKHIKLLLNIQTTIFLSFTRKGNETRFNIEIVDENKVTAKTDRGEVIAWHPCDKMEFEEISYEEIVLDRATDTLYSVAVQIEGEWCTLEQVVSFMQDQFDKLMEGSLRYE